MTEFLTDEWISALDDQVSSAGAPPVEGSLVIGQEVITASETRGYQIVLTPSGARVRPGSDEAATVTFRQSLAIATAIAQGRTTAHEAFMLGQLEVTGDSRALINNSEASAWIETQFASVLAATIY